MLFSRKENIFMCLIAFQKMFRKIFSDVWLCSWKYHRKHIFYLLLTFSHIFSVTKRIHNIIHSSKRKQNPEKKSSNPDKRRRDRDRRSQRFTRSRLTHRAISIEASRDHDRRVHAIAIEASCDRDRHGASDVGERRGAGDVAISSFFLPLSLSLSLSLLLSKAGSHLKWKLKRKWFFVVLALKFGQLEMLFSLTEFEVTNKHRIFWKWISGISLKSIQTQPKIQSYSFMKP